MNEEFKKANEKEQYKYKKTTPTFSTAAGFA